MSDTTLVRAEMDPLVAMLERLAVSPDVDVAKLERLIAMQERILDRNAKAAFDAAFARMQAEIPVVIERGKADRGERGGSYRYATLEDVVEAVRPVLQRHGFALSHRTEYPDSRVRVVGILSHTEGHSRESEFIGLADKSGGKNDLQALGSSNAYGRRYTTFDLLGIATRSADDDGQAGGKNQAAGEAPDGFAEFVDGLSTAATEGTPALMAAFNKGARPLRDYLMRAAAQRWHSLKAAAASAEVK